MHDRMQMCVCKHDQQRYADVLLRVGSRGRNDHCGGETPLRQCQQLPGSSYTDPNYKATTR